MAISFALFLCVFASYAQDTGSLLTHNNLTLRELFRQIEAQTDYNIGYSSRINTNLTVEFDQQSGNVMQIISQALETTPYTYRVIGKYILIIPDNEGVEEVLPSPEIIPEPVPYDVACPETPLCYYCGSLYNNCSCAIPPIIDDHINPFPYPIFEVVENSAQEEEEVIPSPIIRENFPPRFALKTNVLYAATTTINFGVEFRINNHLTLDIASGWNPFSFGSNAGLSHWMIQPTFRYWTREPFVGNFFGFGLMYINFHTGNIQLPFGMMPGLDNHRFHGNAYSVNFQYGHQWRLSPGWGIESTINVGHIFFDYEVIGSQTRYRGATHYFGPTNASLSLIYFFI